MKKDTIGNTDSIEELLQHDNSSGVKVDSDIGLLLIP